MNKRLIKWLCVMLWMGLIFWFSHQPASTSSKMSLGVLGYITSLLESLFHNIDVKDELFHTLIRKMAHFSIYCMLGILVSKALKEEKLPVSYRGRVAFLICVLYAISDEFHQLFVLGRSGQIKDVLIDSFGALLGIGFIRIIESKFETRPE